MVGTAAMEAQEGGARCTVARATMYTMLGLTSVAHFLTREMGPQLIPFICAEFGYNDQQRGTLLAAYFPGYVIGQLPAAMLADRIGGKRVLGLSMWGTVAMMLLTGPSSASITTAFAVTTALGFCGGPLYPVHGIVKRDWMPTTLGAERAMVLRCTNYGMQIGRFLTSILTPFISSRWGWRAAPLAYAAITALIAVPWELWASSTPQGWRGWPKMGMTERRLLNCEVVAAKEKEIAQQKQASPGRPFPWRLLITPQALAPIAMHTADNMCTYCFAYWAPTYFQQVFKVSPTATGAYLAFTHLFSLAGGFVAPAIEVPVPLIQTPVTLLIHGRCRWRYSSLGIRYSLSDDVSVPRAPSFRPVPWRCLGWSARRCLGQSLSQRITSSNA